MVYCRNYYINSGFICAESLPFRVMLSKTSEWQEVISNMKLTAKSRCFQLNVFDIFLSTDTHLF